MKLKKLRKEKGIAQDKAANLLNVSCKTNIKREQDEEKLPKIKLGL